ncbi:MAG: hypothetical protein ACLUR5_04600 [Eubacterium ventriosum]
MWTIWHQWIFVRKGTKINPFIAGGTGSDSLNLNMPKTIPAMLETGKS